MHYLLKDDIKIVIDKIIEDAIATSNTNFHGLFEGNAGVALFCAQAWRYSNDKSNNYQTQLSRHLDMVIHEAMQNEQHPSLATGVTGTAYMLRYLVKKEILDQEDIPYLKEIDNYIIPSLAADFENGNYLLLYGAIGKGIYLFHDLEKNKRHIASIVNFLNNTHCTNNKGHVWWYKYDNEPNKENVINLGLAHGLSSIIMFLMKCYKNDIDKETCKELVQHTMQYILSTKNERNSSLYPIVFNDEENRASRLAWCYGDLNIALILLQGAKLFKNEQWKQEGNIIIENSLKRNFLTGYVNYEKQNGVYDPGFCHGTAGVAYIYQKLHLLSDIPELKRAVIEWLQYTLLSVKVKLKNKTEIIRETKIEGTPYSKSPSKNLIEGFSGIGLVLLYFLYDNDDWCDLFQLDI